MASCARHIALRRCHLRVCSSSRAAAPTVAAAVRILGSSPVWSTPSPSPGSPSRHPLPQRNLRLAAARCHLSTEAAVDDNGSDDEGGDAFSSLLPPFSSLPGLHPCSLHAIEHKMGITGSMTEIQHKTFEAASSGRDVLGRARTGTGKTLAFLLPAIENALRLGRVPGPEGYTVEDEGGATRTGGIAALVLSPTRELAMQIHQQASVLASSHANAVQTGGRPSRHRMRSQVMYGGSSRSVDLRKMEDSVPFILTATPGRLIDHMEKSYVHGTRFVNLIANVSVVVLDEADRCLDMGFRRDIEYILGVNGKQRSQTLLFSATLPRDLRSVMASHMNRDYLTVDCVHDADPTSHTNTSVDQSFVTLPPNGDRWIAGLVDLCQDIRVTHPNDYKVIVFFPTTNMCTFFSHIFNNIYRIPVLEIHSKKSQDTRTRTSDKFRKRRTGLLFTTDVSARGVDYPDVTQVIQFGSAEGRETYIHRLGRTGRAGKKGRGLVVVGSPEEERKFVGEVLRGLDVTRDARLQKVLNGDTGGEDNTATHQHQGNEERLKRIRDAVSTPGSDLQRMASHLYRSLLGYHATKIDNLGMSKQAMVNHVNHLARQMGFQEGAYPALNQNVAHTLNLLGVPGVNVRRSYGHVSFGSGRGRGYGSGRGNWGGRGKDRGQYTYNRGRSGGRWEHNDGNSRSRGGYLRGGRQGGGRGQTNTSQSFDQRWEID